MSVAEVEWGSRSFVSIESDATNDKSLGRVYTEPGKFGKPGK